MEKFHKQMKNELNHILCHHIIVMLNIITYNFNKHSK